MTEIGRTESREQMETQQLSLEQLDRVSGGETLNEAIQGAIILVQFYLHGRMEPAKGPLI